MRMRRGVSNHDNGGAPRYGGSGGIFPPLPSLYVCCVCMRDGMEGGCAKVRHSVVVGGGTVGDLLRSTLASQSVQDNTLLVLVFPQVLPYFLKFPPNKFVSL